MPARCPDCGDLLLTSSLGPFPCSCDQSDRERPIVDYLRRPDPFAKPRGGAAPLPVDVYGYDDGFNKHRD